MVSHLSEIILLVVIVVVFVICGGIAFSGVLISRRQRQKEKERYERRRARTWDRYLREQERWRQRRLHDIVRLLIARNEAAEGIPLATHAPHEREVSCRRKQHQPWHSDLTRQLHNELWAREDEALPEEIRTIIHMRLEDLLAHGRPPEASAGPDILQMLLDGHELHEIVSDSDISSYATNTPVNTGWRTNRSMGSQRNNSIDSVNHNNNNSREGVVYNNNNSSSSSSDTNDSCSSPSNLEQRYRETNHVTRVPASLQINNNNNTLVNEQNSINAAFTDHVSHTNNNNSSNTSSVSNSIQGVSNTNIEQNGSNNNNNNNIVPNVSETDPLNEYQHRMRREEEERRELILEELRAECEGEDSPMHRRYPPAEEVYGIGYVYLINPNNNLDLLYRSYSTYDDENDDENENENENDKDNLFFRRHHSNLRFHNQSRSNSNSHLYRNNSNSDEFELKRSKTETAMTFHERISTFFNFFTPRTPQLSRRNSETTNNNTTTSVNVRRSAFEDRSPISDQLKSSFTCTTESGSNSKLYYKQNGGHHDNCNSNVGGNGISCPEQFLTNYATMSAVEERLPYEEHFKKGNNVNIGNVKDVNDDNCRCNNSNIIMS